MELNGTNPQFEALNQELNDEAQLAAYKAPYDAYQPDPLPRFLGRSLVFLGNLVYGKKPSYLKFRAVEVIARVPYHSWASAAFTLMTLFYTDEKKALALTTARDFSIFASDNETMHVVVVSHLSRRERKVGFVRFTLIPMLFAFLYFWISYLLYLIRPRYSLETNYLFEQHAYESYAEFLEREGELLKDRPVESEYLLWYGRHPRNQYEFFRSLRNDEIVHRNQSVREIDLVADAARAKLLTRVGVWGAALLILLLLCPILF